MRLAKLEVFSQGLKASLKAGLASLVKNNPAFFKNSSDALTLLLDEHSLGLTYHDLHAWKEIHLSELIASLSAKLVVAQKPAHLE